MRYFASFEMPEGADISYATTTYTHNGLERVSNAELVCESDLKDYEAKIKREAANEGYVKGISVEKAIQTIVSEEVMKSKLQLLEGMAVDGKVRLSDVRQVLNA